MDQAKKNITTGLLISTFLAAIEITVISTAMPQIAMSLGSLEQMSWVFAIYLLTTAVTTPIWGKLADLFGRKPVYIIGVLIFLVGCLLCGFASSMWLLILFRAIQGVGAGAIAPVTFTMIADSYSFEQRAKIQGLISSMWGIAGALGPIIGGFLTDYLSWNWIFWINIPFGMISIWLIGRNYTEIVEKRKRKIDYGGAITFSIGMTALLYALLSVSGEIERDSHTGEYIFLYAVAIIFLAIFLFIQMKHEEPMIPLKLFKNRNIGISNLCSFLLSMIQIGIIAYLPLWSQLVWNMEATMSGITIIPLCFGWTSAAMLCPYLLRKFSIRKLLITGACFMVVGFTALLLLHLTTPVWVLVLIVFVIGAGFGLVITMCTLVIQDAAEPNIRGVAGSSNTLMRTLGQTIGIAILGTALNHHLSTDIVKAFQSVFIISLIISVLHLFVVLSMPKRTEDKYVVKQQQNYQA